MPTPPLTPLTDDLAEVARLGRVAFDSRVRPQLRPEDDGKFVAIDVDTGEYEADADDYAANMRLLARRPDARVWLTRAGYGAAYRMARTGGRVR